jgi:hypothetical protein
VTDLDERLAELESNINEMRSQMSRPAILRMRAALLVAERALKAGRIKDVEVAVEAGLDKDDERGVELLGRLAKKYPDPR